MNGFSDQEQLARLKRSMTNQTPSPAQVERIESLRDAAYDFGQIIIEWCPSSANRTHAIRQLEDSLMWAVKSILLDDPV